MVSEGGVAGGEIVRVVRGGVRVCSGGGGVVSVSEGERGSGSVTSESGEKRWCGCALLVMVSDEESV